MPLLTALGIARNVLRQPRAGRAMSTPPPRTSRTAAACRLRWRKGKRFPRLALQMIQVGEESGALDSMLLKTADTFEQETAQALDRMLAALVPVITLVLAGSSAWSSSRCWSRSTT